MAAATGAACWAVDAGWNFVAIVSVEIVCAGFAEACSLVVDTAGRASGSVGPVASFSSCPWSLKSVSSFP